MGEEKIRVSWKVPSLSRTKRYVQQRYHKDMQDG